jgi:hypothetical protein
MILEGTAAAELVWLEFTDFLADNFQSAMAALLDGWIMAQNELASIFAHMMAQYNGQSRIEVEQTLREDQERARQERTGGKSYDEIARNIRLKREQDRNKRKQEIADNLKDSTDNNNAITNEAKATAQREANAARANYDQARARAGALLDPKEIAAPADDERKRQEELRNLLSGGLNFASGERKTTEAVAVKTKEGQEALVKALGFGSSDGDKVKDAILELQGAVVNQLEDLNENMEESNSNLGAW